jgi:hypothetical protein
MTEAIVQKPKCATKVCRRPVIAAVPPDHVASDLTELLPAFPHALVILRHEEVARPESVLELTRSEVRGIEERVAKSCQAMTLARLAATRRAAKNFAQRYRDTDLMPTHVSLTRRDNGKPQLRCEDVALEPVFSEVDLTLADSPDTSVALLGPRPISMGWEGVERRSAGDWRKILGEDGYDLASAITPETGEPFHCAATRVQTVLQTGLEAAPRERMIPSVGERLGASYLSFCTEFNGQSYRWISLAMQSGSRVDDLAILTILFNANRN